MQNELTEFDYKIIKDALHVYKMENSEMFEISNVKLSDEQMFEREYRKELRTWIANAQEKIQNILNTY